MATPTPRTAHPFAMYDEMQAQPQAMTATLAADAAQRDHIARELAGTHAATETIIGPGFLMPSMVGAGRIWLVGCGTAYHAALTAAEWFRQGTEGILDVRAMEAFEFAHYSTHKPRVHDTLVALSHSGLPTATLAAAARAKADGMYTVALTAAPTSPLADICDETLVTTTVTTSASTYTISHLTMLTALADLLRRTVGHLRQEQAQAEALTAAVATLPDLAQAMLTVEPTITALVDALPMTFPLIIAGGGPNWYTALEGALKVREAAYLPATGMQMEEVVHGPIASIDATTVVMLIAPQGPARRRAFDILGALRHVSATTIVLTSADDAELAAAATHALALPVSNELFSSIPATVAMQLFAYWLAIKRGGNPDRIRRDQPQWLAARESYTR